MRRLATFSRLLVAGVAVVAGLARAQSALTPALLLEVAPGQSIGVQRLVASADAQRGVPIYFIAGGPAVAPSEELVRRPALFERLRTLGEVVLVEQRGAGSSQPNMDCDTRWALALDRVPSRAEVIADAERQFRSCGEALRARGIDLARYRTEAYAADLLAVMRHLGHERVRLVAHSYGTMIALELLRAAPERVERAVLAGVMGPGDALRDPAHHERVLATLAAQVGLDPARLQRQTAALLAQLKQHPVAARTSAGVPIVLGHDDIARGLVQGLGRPLEAPTLPRVIAALAEGQLDDAAAWLQRVADGTHAARTGPLARRAAAQHYLTVCANAEPAERRAARSAPSLFGHQLHAPLPDACAAWGLPAAAARPPVVAETPVLLVSAQLDVRTPHEQALAVARTLPRSTLLTLAGAGHGEVLGPNSELDRLTTAFLRGETLSTATLPPSP